MKEKTNDEIHKELVTTHKLCVKAWTGRTISPEYHQNLGSLYTMDQRFTNYYDSRIGGGASQTLKNIIDNFYRS